MVPFSDVYVRSRLSELFDDSVNQFAATQECLSGDVMRICDNVYSLHIGDSDSDEECDGLPPSIAEIGDIIEIVFSLDF